MIWTPTARRQGQRGHTCGTITVDPDRLLPTAHIAVHLTDATARDGQGMVRSDGLGPLLAEWLEDLLGHTRVTVRPVLDQNRIVPADSYECPERMREAVLLRSLYEAFPFSNRSSHGRGIDLDHTVPYVHGTSHDGPDGKPPPGQTRPDNLGPLGRPSHRAKTHGKWKVEQLISGFFVWTSPLGSHYLVTPSRTYPLDEPASPPVESDVEHALGKILAQHTMRRPLPTVLIDF